MNRIELARQTLRHVPQNEINAALTALRLSDKPDAFLGTVAQTLQELGTPPETVRERVRALMILCLNS